MDQTSLQKKDSISEYLKLHKYRTTDDFKSISDSSINEIYDLYKNNIIGKNETLDCWYGIYYEANKQYYNMFSCFVKALEKQNNDNINNILLLAMKNYPYDESHLNKTLNALKKYKNKKYITLFNELKNKKVVINNNNNKIFEMINNFIEKNEMDKVYELYTDLKDDLEKTQYLSKTMVIPKFKPTKNMIDDLIKLDFSKYPDIQLIKSIFSGMNFLSL